MTELIHDHKEAIALYQKVALQAPDLLVEVLPRLAASCEAADEPGVLSRFLSQVIQQDPQSVSAVALVTVMQPGFDDPAALDALQEFLSADPTLSGLVDARRLAAVGEVERTQQLQRIRETLRGILAAGTRYRCRECGYATMTLQWQCPSCRGWETIRPETRISLAAR